MFWNKQEVHRVQAQTVYTTQFDKNRHNRTLYKALKIEPQGYRYFLDTIVRYP